MSRYRRHPPTFLMPDGRLAAMLFAWIVLPMLLLAPGCVETRVVSSSWDGLREIADPPREDGGKDRRRVDEAWSIELQTFAGSDRLQRAFEFSNAVRASGQIADVWFVDRGEDVAVYTGRYGRKNDPEAEAKLKAVREVTLDGKRPFRKAELTIVTRGQGTRDANDLSQYSGRRTLLLAVYDSQFGRDFRRAAEEYASDLRKEHETDIYYYHGPNQSLVTAGLFTQRDFVAIDGVDSYGPGIRELQEIFPTTNRNGQPLVNPELNTPDQIEPSIIVRVP